MKNNNTIYTSGGQVAGVIYGDTLRIVKTSPDHYVRKYHGYGVDPDNLRTAQRQGAKWLEIVTHNGQTYRVRIADFLLTGIPANLGAGLQLFMAVQSMKWYMQRDSKLDFDADPIAERRARQMALFG